MKGKFPDILNSPTTGETARALYDDAQAMLDRVIAEKWLTANAVFGFFPASAVGDDIEVYTDESRSAVLTTLHNLRQQGEHREGVPNRSLGDFVAPARDRLRRPRRRVRGHGRARRPGPDPGVQGGQRRLLRDHAGGARRPAGRGVRRAAAPAGPHRVLGPRQRRAAVQRGPDRREVRRHPSGARATPRAPSTPRSRPCGSCSTSRPTPASSSPRAWRCGRARPSPAGTSPTPTRSTSWSGGSARDQVARLRRAQGLDPHRGRAVAVAEPRLRPR